MRGKCSAKNSGLGPVGNHVCDVDEPGQAAFLHGNCGDEVEPKHRQVDEIVPRQALHGLHLAARAKGIGVLAVEQPVEIYGGNRIGLGVRLLERAHEPHLLALEHFL